MRETLRHAFDVWFFYMTDEGNSAIPIAKFVTIGTGIVAAGLALLILWPFLRRIKRTANSGTAGTDRGGAGGCGSNSEGEER